MILVSKVVEGEIAVIAETEEKAREIAMDLASNHPDTYLDNDTDVVVDSVRSASDHDLEYLIFNGANGSEWDGSTENPSRQRTRCWLGFLFALHKALPRPPGACSSISNTRYEYK